MRFQKGLLRTFSTHALAHVGYDISFQIGNRPLMSAGAMALRICDPRSSITILMIHKMPVHAARNQCTPPQAGLTRSALIQGGDVEAFGTCFHIAMLSTCVFACRNALLWAWRRARRDSKSAAPSSTEPLSGARTGLVSAQLHSLLTAFT